MSIFVACINQDYKKKYRAAWEQNSTQDNYVFLYDANPNFLHMCFYLSMRGEGHVTPPKWTYEDSVIH